MTDNRERLKACPSCGKQPGQKVGPPALARCVTKGCPGSSRAAVTLTEWGFNTPTFNDGIEAAAKWHENEAADTAKYRGELNRYSDDADERDAWHRRKAKEDSHKYCAAAIRSLSRPDDGDGDGGSERNSTCIEGSNANEDSATKSSGGGVA